MAAWALTMRREIGRRREAETSAHANARRLEASQDQLRGANLRLQEMADSIAGAVFQIRVDPAGGLRVEFASGQLIYDMGLEPQALMDDRGTGWPELVDAEDRPGLFDTLRSSLRLMERWEYEFRLTHRSGRRFWLRAEAVPRRQADGGVVASGYLSDVTDRKSIERAIETHEPRIIKGSVDVSLSPDDDKGQMTVALVIRADMWAQPLPMELYLRSSVDVTTGEVMVERSM